MRAGYGGLSGGVFLATVDVVRDVSRTAGHCSDIQQPNRTVDGARMRCVWRCVVNGSWCPASSWTPTRI